VAEPRQEFERELESIEAKVILLYAMIGEDLALARQALLDADQTTFPVLAERDREIDVLYLQVEEMVQREILLQAPVAEDLRFLLSVLRITPELERSHDLIVQLASRAGTILPEDLSPAGRELLARMGDLAVQMWRRTADCWYQRDASVADPLSAQHKEMDDLHARLNAELAAGGLSAPATMELTLIGHFYDRLAAHAANVARRVIYLAGPHRA